MGENEQEVELKRGELTPNLEVNEQDVEFQRGELTRNLEAGKDVMAQSDRAAVLNNVTCPKAEYHFVVLPKEDIANVFALTRDHLPLLDHMMDLANNVIEQQHLPASNFRIGFKIEPFMNRLNMHVISDDFHSIYMRRIQHWNTFNTDLFITFQAVYARLRVQGSVEPMPSDMAEKLRTTMPMHCNQCSFVMNHFDKLKSHLDYHWGKRKGERLSMSNVTNLTQSMGSMHLNGRRPLHANQFAQHQPSGSAGSPQQHFRAGFQSKQPPGNNPLRQQTNAKRVEALNGSATLNVSPVNGLVRAPNHQPVAAKPSIRNKWYTKKKKCQSQVSKANDA